MEPGVSHLFSPGSWPTFVMISARLAGLMMLAPFWSLVSIPRTVRGSIIVVMAALLVPVSPSAAFPDHVLSIPMPLMAEFVVGLGIGLAASVVVQALTLASEIVALQTGLSLGQIISPSIDTGGPALGQLYGLLGLAVFVSVGGPAASLTSVANSLQRIPPGSPLAFDGGAMALLAITGQLFGYAVQIAAPVMVAVTVTNIAVAIINRAVPQLNAMAMSFAVTLGVGLLMFGVSLPLVVRTLSRWTTQAPATATSLVELMADGQGR